MGLMSDAPHVLPECAQTFEVRSGWPNGTCCATCKHWNQYDLGIGFCETSGNSQHTRLSDGGALVTSQVFVCLNWEAKGGAA